MRLAITTIVVAFSTTEVALVAAVPTQNDSTHLFAQRGNHIRHAESYKNVTTESATTAKHTTVKSPWGGAILRGSGFTAASAVVNVPEASGGSSASGSAWVGIDGDTCDRAILQTGFNWYGDGSYVPWYEWYPGLSAEFSGITISEGDQIRMSVIATSVTDGSATLENLSSGEKVTQYFSDVTSASLCETTAEFIIEDYNTCDESGSNCQPVPFASFSPAVEFREISATANGESVPLNDVSIYEVTVNNQERTSCSLSGNTLTCSYV